VSCRPTSPSMPIGPARPCRVTAKRPPDDCELRAKARHNSEWAIPRARRHRSMCHVGSQVKGSPSSSHPCVKFPDTGRKPSNERIGRSEVKETRHKCSSSASSQWRSRCARHW
jgi:hypothetical protein